MPKDITWSSQGTSIIFGHNVPTSTSNNKVFLGQNLKLRYNKKKLYSFCDTVNCRIFLVCTLSL